VEGLVGRRPVVPTPLFVLTHHTRPSIETTGGTTFHFINSSPVEALKVALESAGGLDVRIGIGGGPSTIREFLAADLIDCIHIVIVPIVLGRGEHLWNGLEELEQCFDIEAVNSPCGVTRLTFTRR
jgi:dihydrofolate reductase